MAAMLMLLCGVAGASAPRRPEPQVRVSGNDYSLLADWARDNDFTIHWLKKDQALQLNSHSSKILLTVDSCEAEVNGVQVRLLFPVLYRNGAVFLAQLDLDSTLRPILSPPGNRPGAPIKSICLDPGHGGKDPGYQVGSYQEKRYTLLLAQELRQQLTRAGFKVMLTRTRDTLVELPERAALATKRNADMFISLHFNASPTSAGTVQGSEVYCLTPAGAPSTNAQGQGGGTGWFPGNRNNEKNLFLAFELQKSLTQNLGVEDRGVHRARFLVLRDASMPAVLIEGGFMSHPAEGRKILDPEYRRQMARAIVNGILNYKRVVDPPLAGAPAR